MASDKLTRRSFLGSLGALSALGLMGSQGQPVTTLSNARILLGDGTEVKGGIRIKGTTIEEVGPSVTGGDDLQGATLWPGVWNGGSGLGLLEIDQEGATHDQGEGIDTVLPQARVIDAYNPQSELIPVTRLGGIMGNLLLPADGKLISGQAAWLRTHGNTVSESLLQAPAGLCISLGHMGTGEGGAKSRMGVMLKLRDLFEANKPKDPPAETGKKKKNTEPEAPKEPETDAARLLQKLLKRELKALISVERASDILAAIELVQAYHLDAILMGCIEARLVTPELKASGIPLLYGPVNAQPASYDTLAASCETAQILYKAGIPFAFRNPAMHNLREAPSLAGLAVAYGLPWEAAIAAASGNGPGFFGLKCGQLKAGYEATFCMTNGDPLQARTAVTGLWYQGQSVSLTSRQTELYERFRTITPESQEPAQNIIKGGR